MKASFRIATIAGTEVRVHATFFLLLLFVAIQGMGQGRGLAGALGAVVLVSAMFVCVVLHEFGHVLAAKGYGIRTPDITLLPIGGLARLERMPRNPVHELIVAVCGPLVNVVIAAIIAPFTLRSAAMDADFTFGDPGQFWLNLMKWNLMMVVFNMIPAFPMDGGRVLRALLAMVTDYRRATRLAASIGQALALLVFVTMLLSGIFNPFLMLIAIFIFLAAGQEAAAVENQAAARDLFVRDAMLTEFTALPPGASLRDAVTHLLAGTQRDFPVLDESGGFTGVLSRNKLVSALAEHGPDHPVDQAIETCGQPLHPSDSLAAVMDQLHSSPCPALPVIDPVSGRLVGLLTAENVGEALMVRAALAKMSSVPQRPTWR